VYASASINVRICVCVRVGGWVTVPSEYKLVRKKSFSVTGRFYAQRRYADNININF